MVVGAVEEGGEEEGEGHIEDYEQAEVIGQTGEHIHLALELLELGVGEQQAALDGLVLQVAHTRHHDSHYINQRVHRPSTTVVVTFSL